MFNWKMAIKTWNKYQLSPAASRMV